ncbi:MAG: nucleoside recognition domain-containing protein [Bacilli bacterium]|nr:nucleoside recognition domain-containing protein [Bacilli bacterium]
MKKQTINALIIILLLYIGYEILTNSSAILSSVSFSFNIWKNNIFPSLFPMFILSELLINFGFVEIIGKLLKPLMNKIFKCHEMGAFIFTMSLVSGFPSSAKYALELHKNNLLDENQAAKTLIFSHFSNPLFILGTVSITFLNNKEVGYLILLCHYITNIIIGLLFRNYHPYTNSNVIKDNIKIKKSNSKNLNFGQIITTALLNTINTLLLILGVITMFLVLTTIIDQNINLSSYSQAILNGFIEMTQGLKYISVLSIPLKLKAILSTMIISFGGFSVHMQIMSILNDTKIKYLPFLTARLLHALISGLLVFLLFDIWLIFI